MKSPIMVLCCTNVLLHNPWLRQQWQRWERQTWHSVWSHLPLEILFFNRGHHMTPTQTMHYFSGIFGKSLRFFAIHLSIKFDPPTKKLVPSWEQVHIPYQQGTFESMISTELPLVTLMAQHNHSSIPCHLGISLVSQGTTNFGTTNWAEKWELQIFF